MITKDNLKQVLENLGFKNKNENYVKTINNYTLLIDYKNQSINYPKEIKIHDKTTSNFSHPENFVVFECVHRLLEKGYKAEYLELEPKWNLGRDKKGGKADILVKDNENNPYLIIECKTTDSKNSEFIKEWNRMQEDGGQLFSYFQQEKGVKYLCLYTSDFSDKLEYKNYIIQAYDNEEYLKEKELQNSYKKSNNNIELFKTWKESYELQYFKQGIFEANVNAYKILEITPTFDNLKELKEEGKYHEFAKILRKHNISGKENAFDKLVNIFLCKIYDETFNKNNLKFGYFGVMADTYANMQDRLMWLYKEAMKEFLGEKITFVSNEDIEKDFKQLKIKTLKEVMQNYIKELKFYSNNDFAFLEVHNKELFLKNALVLKEIVELFANYKLTQNSTNQFLGNLFELFLQKGMKQDEGQFFTRERWHIKRDLYDWWLRKIKEGTSVGHRYSCLCVLASYAVKCDIPEDELFTDAFSLLQFLDDMSDDEHNRFTKRDIMDAMQFYQENYVTYSRSEAERVSAIPMPANKRNYQKQADHLEEARAIRDIRMKRQDRDWREGNGRPKGSGEKSKIVEEWQRQHPDGKKADCIRETGLSKPTVYKWWK